MEPIAGIQGLSWAEIAIAGTQALIALTLVFLTRSHHSTQMRTQRALSVHEWGAECIDVLAKADHFCLLAPEDCRDATYTEQKIALLQRLSALIDRGRMFFENVDKDVHGRGKLPAYQGFRPKILDPLVAAYESVNALGESTGTPDKETQDRLWEWRKYFVSLLQIEINPKWLKRATQYNKETGSDAGDHIDASSEAPSEL